MKRRKLKRSVIRLIDGIITIFIAVLCVITEADGASACILLSNANINNTADIISVTLKKDNAELTQKNEIHTEDNSILAGNILALSNRAYANKVVRFMAQKLGWKFCICWKEIYNELLYRHNINLKSRHTKGGKKSATLLEYMHEDEWKDLYQTIAAMLQERYVNPSKIVEKAKLLVKIHKQNEKFKIDFPFKLRESKTIEMRSCYGTYKKSNGRDRAAQERQIR